MATQQPGVEQIYHRLDSSVSTLDDQRTENLKRTQLLHTNKDKSLKKELSRLQKKYRPDHPRVLKISNRLAYNQAAFPELAREIERSEIVTPEITINTWMVHGRVLKQNLAGIKGLTLSLYDHNGKVEKDLGFACTDDRGYFALLHQVEEGSKSPFDPKADYFLSVTDGTKKICHKEEQPLNIVVGQVDYRVIILDNVTCTPPPGWDEDNHKPCESEDWSIVGKVFYDDKKPGTSLRVAVFSEKTDKPLNTSKTDQTGGFKFTFACQQFAELFEMRPDVYLVISNDRGKELYRSDNPLQPKLDAVEQLEIILDRD